MIFTYFGIPIQYQKRALIIGIIGAIILRAMLIHGMIVMGGEEVESAFGASAITGEGLFAKEKMEDLFLKKGAGLGKRVAQKALNWKLMTK